MCSMRRACPLDEEADLLDLSDAAAGPVDAWAVALRLSAARRQSELSAWCSMNKSVLLSKDFTVFARQAMASIGERAAMMRRALPEAQPDDRLAEPSLAQASAAASSILTRDDTVALLGQVNVRLFGGFQVERGGHVVTDAAWRRRKACVIAARLVLAGGAFVGRKGAWRGGVARQGLPACPEALYAGLTSLRAAFGQRGGRAAVRVDAREGALRSTRSTSCRTPCALRCWRAISCSGA